MSTYNGRVKRRDGITELGAPVWWAGVVMIEHPQRVLLLEVGGGVARVADAEEHIRVVDLSTLFLNPDAAYVAHEDQAQLRRVEIDGWMMRVSIASRQVKRVVA